MNLFDFLSFFFFLIFVLISFFSYEFVRLFKILFFFNLFFLMIFFRASSKFFFQTNFYFEFRLRDTISSLQSRWNAKNEMFPNKTIVHFQKLLDFPKLFHFNFENPVLLKFDQNRTFDLKLPNIISTMRKGIETR